MFGILLTALAWMFGGPVMTATPAGLGPHATAAPSTTPEEDEIRRRCPTCVKT